MPGMSFADFTGGGAAPASGGMSFQDFTSGPAPAPSGGTTAPGPRTGLFANIGAGTSEAVANTLGAPVDLATGALNLIPRGINAAAGTHLPTIQNPVGGSDWFKSAQGIIGADPRTVAPADETEQIGRAAGSGLASMVLPWSAARALPAAGGALGAVQDALGSGSAGGQAAVGAASGAAGQYAENRAPDSLKPLANFAGQMVGGGLMLGSVAATKAALDGAGHLAGNYLAPLTDAGQQRLAGQRIAGAATDLPAVRDALSDPQAPLVPGSQPTTFQGTGDQGLGNLERATAKGAPDQFLARANDQNAARVGAIQSLAPQAASPAAVGASFRQMLADLDAQSEARVNAARANAQQATGDLGGAVPVGADQQNTALQQYGQTIRGGLADLNGQARQAESGLWNAIDPDGTLAVDMTPIRQAANDIRGGVAANAAPMAGEEAGIFGTAQMLPQVQPFSELSALRGRITDAMRAELMQNGRTQTYGRLSGLLDSVHDALQGSVEQQAGQDAQAVASGTMAPGDAIVARLQQEMQGYNVGSATDAATGTGGGNGVRASGSAGAPSRPVPGDAGAEIPGSGRPGNPAGNPGLPALAKTGRDAPSLLSFLTAKGGVRDPGGDLAAMDAGKARVAFLRRNGGLSLDYAREAAEEAGYLRPGSDTNDLLDAIGEELRGRKVYPSGDAEGRVAARSQDATGANEHALDQARSSVLQIEDDMGIRLSADEVEHATQLAAMGIHPQEAIEQAARATQERMHGADLSRRAFEARYGVAPDATQAEMNVSGKPRLTANFDQVAADRYQAARQATAERKAIYEKAPGVGAVLKPGARAGEFKLGDSQVPSAIFNSGKGAAERVQAFLKAGGSRADLAGAVKDYAAFDLRRAAEGADGTLDPARYQRWAKAHAEAMAAFPELSRKFETAAAARQTLDETAAQQAERRKAFEASAASHFLGDRDPVKAVGRILRSDTAVATMKELAALTAKNPAARAGLQRAVVEHILSDLKGNAAAGETGTTLLKSDAFQTFARKTPAALSQIFSPKQVEAIRAVAADLQRSNKSVSGTKLPGGSNTAQDLAAGEKHGGGHPSVLGQVVAAEAAGEAVEHLAGPLGKIVGMVGVPILNAMRQAGLRKVDDLVTEAMLHPDLARTLLSKASAKDPLIVASIRNRLAALSGAAGVGSQEKRAAPIAQPAGYGSLATPSTAPRVSAGLLAR